MPELQTQTATNELTSLEIDFISDYIYKKSGIVLGQSKKYLITSRLHTVLRILKIESAGKLISELQKQPTQQLETLVLDALTTNETLWFRDKKPFDALEKVVFPRLQAEKKKRELNIWSAACSSGQEAYSIAMLIDSHNFFNGWKVNIWATDISTQIIDKAQTAVYSQMEMNRGLPINFLIKYFSEAGDGAWGLKDRIRQKVEFQLHNLQSDRVPRSAFDVIFCRNVLIYFDRPTKAKILENMLKVLEPQGLLVVGGSESTIGIHDKYSPVRINPAIFYSHEDSRQYWENG
ncbi:protein-glutamate O-methyltransferase CheR [candidate division KSB1 bacterium]|nr:protein-glutamate O-methyltransferase CheR [candidate division KSB1 bacterium]